MQRGSHAFEFDFILRVERYYSGLMAHAGAPSAEGEEPGLGGYLLYAGAVDDDGRALLVAANIAGAASLAVTPDAAAQRGAIRDGVVDFVVTSLDEALRILKNEVRKRLPVAVCVAQSQAAVEAEMIERGVAPDLAGVGTAGESRCATPGHFGAQPAIAETLDEDVALVTWFAEGAPAIWVEKLDAISLDWIGTDEAVQRRWLRLGPRYIGRLAKGCRAVYCRPGTAKAIAAHLEEAVREGTVAMGLTINLSVPGENMVVLRPSPHQ